MATQTRTQQQSETVMQIPHGVMGVILDTGDVSNREALKTLVMGLFAPLRPGEVDTYLIPTSSGQAWPIGPVTPETFEKQWKEIPFGTPSDMLPGLSAMKGVIGEHESRKSPDYGFRVLLITEHLPPKPEQIQKMFTSFNTTGTLFAIGVIGEGTTRQEAYTRWNDIAPGHVTRLSYENTPQENTTLLYQTLR